MVRYNSVECQLLTFSLLSIYFFISNTRTQSTADSRVSIPQGDLQGGIWTTSRGRRVSAFWGIPYAQPPIGNLRFANPIPASGWTGVRNASVGGIQCPQIPGNAPVGNEDCLYLDVYTPQLPESTNSLLLLPVMVDIHGGGFYFESSSEVQNPHFLLNEDVLLVVPNYRLGPLGFLSTGDEVASGNWGLKDMVLALQWVQSNIKYFGGDPDQVTLFGESAGGCAVHLLSLINATDGLFHRYITQSGSALASWAYRPRAQYAKFAFELGEYVGCSNDSSNSLIDCLRKVDALEIIATRPRFSGWHTLSRVMWGPTDEPDIEGAVLTESPAELFAAGRIRDLPWITGVVRDEGLMYSTEFYVDEAVFHDFLDQFDSILPVMLSWTYLPDSGAALVDAVKSFYLGNDLTADKSVLIPQLTLLIGDVMFNYPAYNGLRQQFAIAKNPQYLYNFHYRGGLSFTMTYINSTKNYGVTHADDVIYIFSRTQTFADYEGNMTETDLEMADIMTQLWTSFATNGTPTSPAFNGSITWDPYSSMENYLRIGNDSDLELDIQYSFYTERMQFWADLEATTTTPATVSASSASYSSRILFLTLLLLTSKLVSVGKLIPVEITSMVL